MSSFIADNLSCSNSFPSHNANCDEEDEFNDLNLPLEEDNRPPTGGK
jgi:hypothetical protein